MKDQGGYVFQSTVDVQGDRLVIPGMTMRQWYKGKAIQGILANPDITGCGFHENVAAESAAHIADAMITEDRQAEKA